MFNIKEKLQQWLGIKFINNRINEVKNQLENLSEIHLDHNFKGSSKIIVITPLNGGRIKFVEVDFRNESQLSEYIKEVELRYGCGRLKVIDSIGDYARTLRSRINA